MRLEDLNIGDPVVYIPHHLLIGDKDKMVKEENLGTVTNKNAAIEMKKIKNRWSDENNNSWNAYLETEESALIKSKSLTGCSDCFGCSECSDCSHLSYSSGCSHNIKYD